MSDEKFPDKPRYELLDPNVQPPADILPGQIVHRPSFAHVQLALKEGEEVVADAGTMLWMDSEVSMQTSCVGGMCKSYYRTCAGESCCQNTYKGPGEIAFGFDLPGDVMPFYCAPDQGWMLTTGAFICGSPNISVSGKWSGCAACMCGGEGAFFTHIKSEAGSGVFYAGDYGSIKRHDVPEGKCFVVNTGLFFACSDQVSIEVAMAGGCKTCMCGGEGFVMRFRGPCSVYTQNRNPAVMLALLNPPRPPAGPEKGAEAAADVASG